MQGNADNQVEVRTFELFPGRTLSLMLFHGVANVSVIRDAILGKTLDVALIKADLVPHPDCVHVAANKALHAAINIGKLRAASLHAELVHCLHAGRNVGEALRALGASPSSTDVLVAVLDADDEIIARMTSMLDRPPTALSGYYPARANASAICDLYRIAPEELLPPGATLPPKSGQAAGNGGAGGARATAVGAANAWAVTSGPGEEAGASAARHRLLTEAVIGRIAVQEWTNAN